MDPTGFRHFLSTCSDRHPDTPLFDVENGPDAKDALVVEDGTEHVDDSHRIDHLRDHIASLMAARREDGIDVFGYTTWGPIDLVAFATGQMAKRHGFVYVDRHDDGTGDLHRVGKDSLLWYRRVIAGDGREPDRGRSPGPARGNAATTARHGCGKVRPRGLVPLPQAKK